MPNIIGTHTIVGAKYLAADGCFEINNTPTNDWTDSHDREGKARIIKFNAANGEHHYVNGQNIYRNDIYGKSNTVQPPAIQMMFIIKT